jgi:DME family drug/metabolite transporter
MGVSRRARLQVVGAAALFSTGGAAIKSTGFEGISGGLEVASLRSGVAAVAVAVVLPASRRNWTRRTWAVGAAYAITVVLFVLANKQTTSANAIFLQSTAPLYVLLAGVFILRERVRSPDVLVMLVIAAGLSLFVVSPGEAVTTAPNPALGNVLALISWGRVGGHPAGPARHGARRGGHRGGRGRHRGREPHRLRRLPALRAAADR